MKKLLIVALLAVATTAVAQPRPNSSPTVRSASSPTPPAGMLGQLTTPVVVASSVTAAVAVAVAANAGGAAKPEVVKTLKCEGNDPLVNNVCVRTTQVTSVTSSGTGTATTTVVVPVTSTYAPTLQ